MDDTKNPPVELFLDFDGVICNSLDECFVSSWLAFFGRDSVESVDYSGRPLFDTYRPFIRSGADYLVLQHCIDRKIPLVSQSDFDRAAEALGDRKLDEFHTDFYRVRSSLLSEKPDYWLGLNPLYPELSPYLSRLEQHGWIITTKEASFAARILAFHGIEWTLPRIICSGRERKLDIIARTVESKALVIDDQIDHLVPNPYERIGVLLAAWGFVKPEWLNEGVPTLDADDIGEVLRPFL